MPFLRRYIQVNSNGLAFEKMHKSNDATESQKYHNSDNSSSSNYSREIVFSGNIT